MVAAEGLSERFTHVDTWVFDLDNTLYPPHCDLWPRIDDRMTVFMAGMLGLDGMSTRALQKFYYRQHGTTLRGLIDEYGIDPAEFLRFVHDIDRTSVEPDVALAAGIAALPGRKLIFTNGSRDHALRTCERLGIGDHFDDVFDIVAADLVPKPDPRAYDRFFDRHGIAPERTAMFEDIARNLIVPKARQMMTVLVVPKPGAHDFRDGWDVERERPDHVDFLTHDLSGFLTDIIGAPALSTGLPDRP
ncbi:MAG: pyrimidine 5'-nucleotidase [Rhizobiales bacterium 62-17]|nr:pyrimidine 5'-nucleotidase [Hyphomicrobiales bacterium]OJY00980.1 MAG: pyrimidine 5'-nucleotidase [Rhizobiales bacterium 62-17]